MAVRMKTKLNVFISYSNVYFLTWRAPVRCDVLTVRLPSVIGYFTPVFRVMRS
jgi:hypothetical protein